MRAVSALVFLCVGFLVVSTFQSIQQELSIQALRARIEQATNQVHKYEDGIIQLKLKIQEINGRLDPVKSKKTELTKKRDEMNTAGNLVLKDIEECQVQKAEAENAMNTAKENLRVAKVQQGSDKAGAAEEIKKLKQEILERDKKLCQYVDSKQEEGRKLCGALEAIK